ncbi:MAG: hypothetical protein OXQ89_08720 [Rhodospirillaceae bacterium]|nr:hypothetical protein [Rhodospirillaceae bacterium]
MDKSTCRLADKFALRLLEQLPVEDGIRVLWALDPDVPEVVLDASNETMLQGVVAYWGRGVRVRLPGPGDWHGTAAGGRLVRCKRSDCL